MAIEDGELPPIEQCTFIRVPPEDVWNTLTQGEGWDAWFTCGTEVDARPGGRIRLRWKDFGVDHITTEDGGPVLEAEPNRRFVFQWHPGSVPTTVALDLEPLEDGTLVKLTESGYPAQVDDLRVELMCAAGWGEAMSLLKFYLEHRVKYGAVPVVKAR